MPDLGAIILTGGGARRMGGVRKTRLLVGGRSLVGGVVAAAAAACDDLAIVVGDAVGVPSDLMDRVRVVREEPPGGGPVDAIAAGLPHVGATRVLLLAGDLVEPGSVVRALMTPPLPTGDGRVLVDDSGREQWLSAVIATAALRNALELLGGTRGARMAIACKRLDLQRLPVGRGVTDDIDTWSDLFRARSVRAHRSTAHS